MPDGSTNGISRPLAYSTRRTRVGNGERYVCHSFMTSQSENQSRHDITLDLVRPAIDRAGAVVEIARHGEHAVGRPDGFDVGAGLAGFRLFDRAVEADGL